MPMNVLYVPLEWLVVFVELSLALDVKRAKGHEHLAPK